MTHVVETLLAQQTKTDQTVTLTGCAANTAAYTTKSAPISTRDVSTAAVTDVNLTTAAAQTPAKEPLSGKETQPTSGGGGVPISDAIFSGASAAYYAALFAFEAVKSMGDVQEAFNVQEVNSFEQLLDAWDKYATDDGNFIKQQGQAMLYSGIASAVGAGLSVGVLGWGVMAPKGLLTKFGIGEDLEGQLNRHYAENGNVVGARIVNTEPPVPEVAAETEAANNNAGRPQTRQQHVIEIEEENEAEGALRNQGVRGDDAAEGADGPNETDKAAAKRAEKQAEWAQEKLKQHTNKFQTVGGVVQQAATSGASLGQGIGQMNSSGVKEDTDKQDKAKQVQQQLFNTDDAGWSSAVQTLKEMTSAASRSINEIAGAEQRA